VDAPPLTPLAAAALHVAAPERALVIDCGTGDAVLLLAREFPAARVRGVDPSPQRVRRASARIGLDPEGRVAFKAGKAGSLPYPDDFFDLVVQVDGRPAPAEIARVLRAGGNLILVHSQPVRIAGGARESLLNRRLLRHGVVPVEAAEAGGGKFFVGRLGDGRSIDARI
jgi:ubiquinone/menaquinone biosynthesis C-methylase UbiE